MMQRLLLVKLALVLPCVVAFTVNVARLPTSPRTSALNALPSIVQSVASVWPAVDVSAINLNHFSSSVSVAAELDIATPAILGDLPVSVVAIGAVVLIAAAAASSNSGGSESSASSGSTKATAKPAARKSAAAAKLEIPYDAAARFAYDTWRRENGDVPFNAAGYAVFEELYLSQAVAEATTKKLKRDMQAFDNKGRAPVPPRQMSPPRAEEANVPFFAE